jgi:hypothetical protein
MATDTEYTRQEQAKLAAILSQEKYVELMKLRADMQKRKAALAKRQYEHAVATLMETIKSDSSQLLLPGMEDADPPRIPSWEDTPVSVVVGDKACAEKLAEYNITTLGQLAAWTNAGEPLTKVGLTEQQEAKVQTCLEIYWNSEPGQDD